MVFAPPKELPNGKRISLRLEDVIMDHAMQNLAMNLYKWANCAHSSCSRAGFENANVEILKRAAAGGALENDDVFTRSLRYLRGLSQYDAKVRELETATGKPATKKERDAFLAEVALESGQDAFPCLFYRNKRGIIELCEAWVREGGGDAAEREADYWRLLQLDREIHATDDKAKCKPKYLDTTGVG